MCPMCLAAAAWVAVSAGVGSGLSMFVALKAIRRRVRPDQQATTSNPIQE